MFQKLRQFCWIGGFWLLVELHCEGSAINGATQSSLNTFTINNFTYLLFKCKENGSAHNCLAIYQYENNVQKATSPLEQFSLQLCHKENLQDAEYLMKNSGNNLLYGSGCALCRFGIDNWCQLHTTTCHPYWASCCSMLHQIGGNNSFGFPKICSNYSYDTLVAYVTFLGTVQF